MKNIIVLDTETCGGLGNPLVYDLGYLVADLETGAILKTRSYTIKDTFNDLPTFETAYYKEKRPLYLADLMIDQAVLINFDYALRQLKKDINKFEVQDLYAYNSAFDIRAIRGTAEKFKVNCNPATEIVDIMDFIGVITETEDYKKFCVENGYMTKHKRPQCQKKAETLKRYLSNDIKFTEDHTALSDSGIELEILLNALERLAAQND